jgi:hypothetical protein
MKSECTKSVHTMVSGYMGYMSVTIFSVERYQGIVKKCILEIGTLWLKQ